MLTIWKFVDGKRGHENQSTGLIGAIDKRRKVQVHEIEVDKLPRLLVQFFCLLFRKKPKAFPNGNPDLIIGAGRKTHAPMLLAKSLCGGKAVVLMRPSLLTSMYDLVVVPQHDHFTSKSNVVEIKGVLNAIHYRINKDTNNGLILVGGVSSHFRWNEEQVFDQIKIILNHDESVQWTMTTSRRTPGTFLVKLRNYCDTEHLIIVPYEDTDQQWMLDHYNNAGQIWVTPDSVSMVYESLSSGAITRVFSLCHGDSNQASRVVRGLEDLINQSIVTTFDQWQVDPQSQSQKERFNEADRVAAIVLERLL